MKMKINPKFNLRNVGGKNIIVSELTMKFDGIITVNDTGEFIWRMLENGAEEEGIVKALARECNTAEDEIREDVSDFIKSLKKAGIVEQ